MTTPSQVKQSLELALTLASSLGKVSPSELKELGDITNQIREWLKPGIDEELVPTPALTIKHPIDALLKKGKVELSEGRYKQLTQIHHELSVFNVKFLSAKQNQATCVIWFPLEWNGDKSAALYLSSSEWSVAPIKYRDDNDLTGEWEGFDLTEFMDMNCPEFDQDEY